MLLNGNSLRSLQHFHFLAEFQSLRHWQTWPLLSSPCFWEELVIFLHLAFLGSSFIQFLQKRINVPCKQRSAFKENEAQNHAAKKHSLFSLNVSFTYKASIVCCSLPLAIHLLILLLLLLVGNGQRRCGSSRLVLSAEIAQAVSWLVTLVGVLNFQKTRSVMLPWIIRVWWVCSFFQSVIHAAIDFHAILTHHGVPGKTEYADFLSMLACTYLLGISIRGTTGISFSSSSITDPLLYASAEKRAEGKVQSTYGRATLLQLVTFSWLNPLFVIGRKKPLEQDEIPDVDIKDSAEFLSNAFDAELKRTKEGDGRQTPSIYKTIYLFIRKKAAINAAFAVVHASTSYVGPYLINDFVKFLSEKKQRSLQGGYVLALAFLSAKMVETVAQRQWIFGARQLGLRLRAALISHIYKKGLHLSSQSRQSHTSGEIINYMSVDIQRVTDFIWYMNMIWMLPIQISLTTYILHMNLGLGSLAGLAATALVMTCNVPITRIQKRLQSKIMEAKDERMKATSEVLRNMKTLKLQAWDTRYLRKLESLRKIESHWLWKSLRLSAISAFIFWGSPTFISVVTFGACMLMGIPLTAGRVLSALATFRMLQDPIFNLPDLLSVLAQAKVSVDRVAAYLQEDEIQSDAVEFVPRNETEFEVEIDSGEFSWDVDSRNPTLSGLQLKIKRGMKVAVCGTVGSGKSSLIACILGEIPKLSGTVKISGTKAYVPQSPWILTGNVRENITFGNPFNSDKYNETIQACALTKDFELFSHGDLTAVRGGALVPIILIAQSMFQILQIASNYWMAWASPTTTGTAPTVKMSIVFLVYILLSVGSSLCVLVRSMLVAITSLLTSQKFFSNMLHSILHAPMSFFDSTPKWSKMDKIGVSASGSCSVLEEPC